MQMQFDQLKIVSIKKYDEKFLYDLRNHVSTRKHMFNNESISLDTHKKWFLNSLANTNRDIFVFLKVDQKIGQIRFDKRNGTAQVDLAVIDSERGKGYGTVLLMMACHNYLKLNSDINYLSAKIKKENFKSTQAFLKTGFQKQQADGESLELRLYNTRENIIIATTKSWNINNFFKIKDTDYQYNWILIKEKQYLDQDLIKHISPKFIFFPHWSWMIPESIFLFFKCIVFHMTDLPFGRGGSPLQNLISRGIYKTKISAINVVEEMDAGDIYCQHDFDLSRGSADKLFCNASDIVFKTMIPQIITKNLKPRKQKGDVICFDRRKPEDSDISNLETTRQIYDYIRMLDGEEYPRAFINQPNFKVEFSNARQEGNKVYADCVICQIYNH